MPKESCCSRESGRGTERPQRSWSSRRKSGNSLTPTEEHLTPSCGIKQSSQSVKMNQDLDYMFYKVSVGFLLRVQLCVLEAFGPWKDQKVVINVSDRHVAPRLFVEEVKFLSRPQKCSHVMEVTSSQGRAMR